MFRHALLVVVALLLVACRQSAQPDTAAIEIDLRAESLAVGRTTLVVTLTDAGGDPVSAVRTVEVRGDMNHAGMTPVIGQTAEGADGVYPVPFEWTMSGDWIVTVAAELPDGTRAEKQFDLRVAGP